MLTNTVKFFRKQLPFPLGVSAAKRQTPSFSRHEAGQRKTAFDYLLIDNETKLSSNKGLEKCFHQTKPTRV